MTTNPWGVAASTRVWVGGNARGVRRRIEAKIVGARRPPTGSIDVALIAPASADEFAYFARKLSQRLAANGSIWAVCSGSGSDPRTELEAPLDDLPEAVSSLALTHNPRVVVTNDLRTMEFTRA